MSEHDRGDEHRAEETIETVPESTGAGRSVWENLRDVVVEPSATFEEVAERPTWLVPLLVILGVTVVVTFLSMPLWSEMQELAMAERGMSAEQREQAVQQMEVFQWLGLVIAPIATAVMIAIVAFIFYGWAAVTGARNARYPVAFAATVYAGVIMLFQSIGQAVVIQLKGAEQVAREGGPPTFGLALFIERGDMPAVVWGFVQNVNFFSIWYTVVLAIAGIHALKMGKGSAWSFAIAMWVVGGLLMMLQGFGGG